MADIKRMNGLVTDLQMFALKTIHIPLPGRHPPSPGLSNGLDTPQRYFCLKYDLSYFLCIFYFDILSGL